MKERIRSLEPIELYPPSKMPAEVEKVYKHLHGDVLELIWRWKMYDQLYMRKETIDLLNESASNTFGLIQNSLIDSILLLICRVTDPHKSRVGKNENLTFELLKNTSHVANNLELNHKIVYELARLEPFLKEARSARNKRISHNDLESIMANKSFPIKIQSLTEIMIGFGNLLNVVEEYFGDSIVDYPKTFLTGVDTLLIRLDIARKHINRKFGTPCCC